MQQAQQDIYSRTAYNYDDGNKNEHKFALLERKSIESKHESAYHSNDCDSITNGCERLEH